MNGEDQARLAACLEAMRLTLRNPPDFTVEDDSGESVAARVFVEALRDFSIVEIGEATAEALRTCVFFPTPSELASMIRRTRRALRDVNDHDRRVLALTAGPRMPMPPDARAALDELYAKFPASLRPLHVRGAGSDLTPGELEAEERQRDGRVKVALEQLDEWRRRTGAA